MISSGFFRSCRIRGAWRDLSRPGGHRLAVARSAVRRSSELGWQPARSALGGRGWANGRWWALRDSKPRSPLWKGAGTERVLTCGFAGQESAKQARKRQRRAPGAGPFARPPAPPPARAGARPPEPGSGGHARRARRVRRRGSGRFLEWRRLAGGHHDSGRPQDFALFTTEPSHRPRPYRRRSYGLGARARRRHHHPIDRVRIVRGWDNRDAGACHPLEASGG